MQRVAGIEVPKGKTLALINPKLTSKFVGTFKDFFCFHGSSE
jgi:hypothetical protein